MADPRFFQREGPFSLAELCELADARLDNAVASDRIIEDVAPIDKAGPADITFLDNPRYLPDLAGSQAGACLVTEAHAKSVPEGTAALVCRRPYLSYAWIAAAFYPEAAGPAGIHESAVIDPTATVAEDVSIAANVVIGSNAEIGPRCRLEPGVVIGPGVTVGEDTRIGAAASLSHCVVGARAQIHPGVRIGTRGFGFAMDPQGHVDVPQLGCVIVEDDVEIGANCTIDRGAGPDTVIGRGAKIDNLVQIGHNVRVGAGCVLVAQSGVAGSTKLGEGVVLAAQAGVAGHLTVAPGAQIGAQAGVMRDVPAGERLLGSPAMPAKRFFRLVKLWDRLIDKKGEAE